MSPRSARCCASPVPSADFGLSLRDEAWVPTRSGSALKCGSRATIKCSGSLTRNNELCRLRARQTREDLAFMELIVSSMIGAMLLLVGHLGVLVHQRLVAARWPRPPPAAGRFRFLCARADARAVHI